MALRLCCGQFDVINTRLRCYCNQSSDVHDLFSLPSMHQDAVHDMDQPPKK